MRSVSTFRVRMISESKRVSKRTNAEMGDGHLLYMPS
jgi:hypothetical protein